MYYAIGDSMYVSLIIWNIHSKYIPYTACCFVCFMILAFHFTPTCFILTTDCALSLSIELRVSKDPFNILILFDTLLQYYTMFTIYISFKAELIKKKKKSALNLCVRRYPNPDLLWKDLSCNRTGVLVQN